MIVENSCHVEMQLIFMCLFKLQTIKPMQIYFVLLRPDDLSVIIALEDNLSISVHLADSQRCLMLSVCFCHNAHNHYDTTVR